jgi:8-oxo-dGTP diphosphatase
MSEDTNFDFKKHTDGWRLLLATDMVAFTFIEKKLHVLLIKRRFDPGVGKWAIPGGFVHEDESLDEGAIRELKEETGMNKPGYIEQLYTFGEVDRDPRARVISVAYLILLNESHKLKLRAATDAREVKWFPVKQLPELSFGESHSEIIEYARQRLKWKLEYTNVAFGLLPKEFTLTQMQQLYESVYNEKIDKRNFRKKVLALDMVEPIDKVTQDLGRPAQLYKAATKKLVMYNRVV